MHCFFYRWFYHHEKYWNNKTNKQKTNKKCFFLLKTSNSISIALMFTKSKANFNRVTVVNKVRVEVFNHIGWLKFAFDLVKRKQFCQKRRRNKKLGQKRIKKKTKQTNKQKTYFFTKKEQFNFNFAEVHQIKSKFQSRNGGE